MTVTVKKLGGSVAVVIPRAVAREMGLTDGMPLDISTTDDAILMRRRAQRPRRSLSSIVKRIKPASYRRRSAEMQDAPRGREIW